MNLLCSQHTDILLRIIYAAREAPEAYTGGVDACTLGALLTTCRYLHSFLLRHWDMIVVAYTTTTVDETQTDEDDDDDSDEPPKIPRIRVLFCGLLHCVGGPAVSTSDDKRLYYVYGQLHRGGDLPAIDSPGRREWYIRGKLHRAGGLPAIEKDEGSCRAYWRRGVYYRDDDLPHVTTNYAWLWHTGDTTSLRHRGGDRPAVVRVSNDASDMKPDWTDAEVASMTEFPGCIVEWYHYGTLHREGGKPARIYPDGRREWYRYGALQVIDGPARPGDEPWQRVGIQ